MISLSRYNLQVFPCAAYGTEQQKKKKKMCASCGQLVTRVGNQEKEKVEEKVEPTTSLLVSDIDKMTETGEFSV